MSRLARLVPVLALPFLALLSARAEPVAPLRLESLVPSTSLAFASLEDVGTWGARWERTALGKLLADPEMKAFLDPVVEDLRRLAESEGRKRGPGALLRLLNALSGLKGQAATCLVDLEEGRRPVLVAALDFGGQVADFTTFLDRLGSEEGEVPTKREEEGGRTWWTVGGDLPFVVTVLGASVVAATDRAWLEGVVRSGGTPVEGSLARSEAFRASREKVGGADAAAFVWANVPRLLERVRWKPDERAAADALGLDTVLSAAYGLAFRGDGFADTFHVAASGADHGLLPLFASKPPSGRARAWAPATAFFYEEAANASEPAALLRTWRDLMAKVEPKEAAEVDEFFRSAREVSGVDLERDLLAGLTGEGAVWAGVPETGGVYPELAYLAALKDGAAFEPVFERAVNGFASWLGREERVNAVQRTIEYRGKRLHVLDLAKARGKEVVPFTPTWAVLDGWLVVTLVPHAMKELILRRESNSPGLDAEEDVKAILASAPAGFGTFVYVDLQAALNLLYDTGVPLLQAAVKPNVHGLPVRLDWALLPAARTVRPYLRSLAAFVVADGKGLTLSAQSPTGILPPLAVVLALAIPALSKRSHHAQSASVHRDMTSLSTSIQTHVALRNELPASLEELTRAKDGEEPVLDRVPTDPWGRPYRYRVTDAGARRFELRSSGPDRRPDTPDDLVFDSEEGFRDR